MLKMEKKKQPSFLATHTAKMMEYILVYAKNYSKLEKLSIERISDGTKKVVNLTNSNSEMLFTKGVRVKIGDEGIIPKGIYTIKTMAIEYLDDVKYKNGKTVEEVRVKAQFIVSQEKINEYIEKELLFITINKGLRRTLVKRKKIKKNL